MSLFYSDFKNHLPKLNTVRTLNILANGPSLSSELKTLDYKVGDYCVVNRFYESELYKIIKPKYYVIADPYFFTKMEYIDPVLKDVDWEMTFLVSFSGWRKMKKSKLKLKNNIHVVPFHTIPFKGYDFIKLFLYRKGLSMPTPQNVLVPSIFCGINMGYNIIYLYGADHSWTKTLCVNDENQVCAIDKHFYETEVELSPYLKFNGEYYKIYELLRDFATMFESYHDLRKYAAKVHSRIINKTKGSFIDAFERG